MTSILVPDDDDPIDLERALLLDGEKLRALTGKDHGPFDLEDDYGNPIDGDRLIFCCFPDCGCDGARLCMAERGASSHSLSGNVEGMWSGKTRKQRQAVFDLAELVSQADK